MTNLVRAIGPRDARIAIVGEAPGANEEKQGVPFVGQSGKLLDQLLRKAGLSRSELWITNVIKERPPGNNIEHFIKFSAAGAKRTDAYDLYEAMLLKELQEVDPIVIVPMGKTAFYAVTGIVCSGKDGITKRRGSVYTSSQVGIEGKKIIPTVHPAYILRGNFADSFTFIHDFTRIREESAFEEVRATERSLRIPKTFAEAEDYLFACKNSHRTVGFDIEVVNEEVFCFALGRGHDDVMVFPLMTEEGKDYWTPEQERYIWDSLAMLLIYGPQLVLQNCMFDLTFMLRKMGMCTHWDFNNGKTRIHDTMIAQAILTPDMPKGLAYIASVYTKEPFYKDEGKTHSKFGKDWEQFLLYNAKDVAVTMEAFEGLERDLKWQGNWDTYLKRMALLPALTFMQEHGVRLDHEGMALFRTEVLQELRDVEKEVNAIVGRTINIRSPKQLADYFYKELKNTPYRDRKTGKVTTDQNALERLAVKEVPAAAIVADYKLTAKSKDTYLDVELDDDGRLRGSMNPVGTGEGRISSGKSIFGTGGNMQNQPKYMKKFFIADEGMAFYEIDLSQAENRLVALLSGDEAMLGAFENDIDIHSLTASPIFNCRPDEVTDEEGDSGIGKMSQRDIGKRSNHGFNYDLGYKTFALVNRMKERDAKKIHTAYHKLYWSLRLWHRSIEKQLYSNRTLTNLFGRKRWFQGALSGDTFRQAYAFIPQSTIADHTLNVVQAIYDDQEAFEHVSLVNTVHDSIWFQIPLSQSWSYHVSVVHRIEKLLAANFMFEDRYIKIPTDAYVGGSMGSLASFDPKSLDPLTILNAWRESELPLGRKELVST